VYAFLLKLRTVLSPGVVTKYITIRQLISNKIINITGKPKFNPYIYVYISRCIGSLGDSVTGSHLGDTFRKKYYISSLLPLACHSFDIFAEGVIFRDILKLSPKSLSPKYFLHTNFRWMFVGHVLERPFHYIS